MTTTRTTADRCWPDRTGSGVVPTNYTITDGPDGLVFHHTGYDLTLGISGLFNMHAAVAVLVASPDDAWADWPIITRDLNNVGIRVRRVSSRTYEIKHTDRPAHRLSRSQLKSLHAIFTGAVDTVYLALARHTGSNRHGGFSVGGPNDSESWMTFYAAGDPADLVGPPRD